MVKSIITFFALVFAAGLTAQAYRYDYDFTDVSVAQALIDFHKRHPELRINFIYDELEDYRVNRRIRADRPVDAVKQLVSYNPISVMADSTHIYVEAMQRGKYRYTGRAVDEHGKPVPFVSVLLLSVRDSTLVTYGVTGDDGRFIVPCDRKKVLAKFSSIGYKTTFHKCAGFNLGDVLLPSSSINLKGVVVESDEPVIGHDKIMMNVSRKLQRHSFDGYSLLNMAMIPGLDVDPFERKVSSEGQGVLLCINGVNASQGDVRTLNPKDVVRIDFYTGFDPRHPTSRFVVDFIVKVREYGGAVMFEANQRLNRPTGSGLADWRMNRGKSQFGVRIDDDYDAFAKGRYFTEMLDFDFDKGVARFTTSGSVNKNRKNTLKAKPYLVRHGEKSSLKFGVSVQRSHDRVNTDAVFETKDWNSSDEYTACDMDHTDRIVSSMSGYYQLRPDKQSWFTTFWGGSFSRTDGSHVYVSPKDDIRSDTKERFYKGNASAQYTRLLAGKHSVLVAVGGNRSQSRIDYGENDEASISRLITSYVGAAIGDNYRISRNTSVNLQLFGEWYTVDNRKSVRTTFSFIPKFDFRWSDGHGKSLGISTKVSSGRPPMSYYSPTEKWIYPYLRLIGNPGLRPERNCMSNLTLHSSHKWGYVQFLARYSATTDCVYQDYYPDNERDVFVQTFRNGGTYHNLSVTPTVQFTIIPQTLRARFSVTYRYNRTNNYESEHINWVEGSSQITYMAGGFQGNLSFTSVTKSLNKLGVMSRGRMHLSLGVGYNIDGWSVGASFINPFRYVSHNSAHFPNLTAVNESYDRRSSCHILAFRVGYRFNYGKPKKKYDDVEVTEGENSAILGR